MELLWLASALNKDTTGPHLIEMFDNQLPLKIRTLQRDAIFSKQEKLPSLKAHKRLDCHMLARAKGSIMITNYIYI